jgi:hypothetical protein
LYYKKNDISTTTKYLRKFIISHFKVSIIMARILGLPTKVNQPYIIADPPLGTGDYIPMTVMFEREKIFFLLDAYKASDGYEKERKNNVPLGGIILFRKKDKDKVVMDPQELTLSIGTWGQMSEHFQIQDFPTPNGKFPMYPRMMSSEMVKFPSPFFFDNTGKNIYFDLVFFTIQQIERLFEDESVKELVFRRDFTTINGPDGTPFMFENLIAEPRNGLFTQFRQNEQLFGYEVINYEYGFSCPPIWKPQSLTLNPAINPVIMPSYA